MNLNDLLKEHDKNIASKNILNDKGSATIIRIKKGEMLRKHQSMTNALLVVLKGSALYEEKIRKIHLKDQFDYVQITAKVPHEVKGVEDCMLLLIQ